MEQTAQQRANSLNPTAVTFNIPSTEGLFRGVGDYGSQLYRRVGNRIESVNLLNPSLGLYTAGTVGAGNQSSQALAALKNQYGLDWNSLAQVNLGDLNSQGYNQGLQVASKAGPDGGPDNFFHSFSGGLQDFLGAKQNVQTAPVLVNNTPNALTPITPQSIENGIKNLQTPTVLSSQQQNDYFASQGNAANPLSPTDWLNKINTESSKGATPLPIATSTATTTKADTTAAGADTTAKSIQDYIKLLTPETSATSTGVKNLLATITADLEGLKGRGTAQLSAEDAQGVAAKKQILQNAQTELNQKLAEYKAIQAKYEALNTNIEGKAITMNSIVGSQAQVERVMRSELNMKSSEIAMIQANVSAAQGNLTLAQDAADRAVDLKYDDAKDAIDVRLKQLELFQGELTKEETIRADAVKLYLADQKTQLATQVANEKDKNATLLNQMQKYPDAGITLSDTIESANRKITQNSRVYQKEVTSSGMAVNGMGGAGSGVYANDLDAIVGTVLSTIPSKFGQQTFSTQISRARDDADKLNIVAAQVLQSQPAEFKSDFRNQAVGIAQLDKAIAELDAGVKTGVLKNSAQYVYNIFGKDFDPKLAKINGYITSAIQPYRNSVTGAAWGTQEDNEYQQLFGSTKYSPTELRQRLVQTKELLKSKSAEGLNAFTNPLGYYENRFNTGGLAPEVKDVQTSAKEDIYDTVMYGDGNYQETFGTSLKNLLNNLFVGI